MCKFSHEKKIWGDWKEIQNTKSEPRCKWVKEIEGFGISTNWLFSKLIERRENRPPKAPLFTCFNRLWLRLIFSSVGILPNVEDCNWESINLWVRGRSQTTLTKFCPFCYRLPPSVENFLIMNVDKKSTFLDYLPPFSCKRSLWTTP